MAHFRIPSADSKFRTFLPEVNRCAAVYLFTGSRNEILPCEEVPIGMENGRIADNLITSNSSVEGLEARKARLNHNSAWCAQAASPSYLQVDLNATYLVCAISTQGDASNLGSAFVEEYKMEFSLDGAKWDFYRSSVGVKVCFL